MDIAFLLSYGALWVLVVLEILVLLGLIQAVHRLQQAGSSMATESDGQSTMIGKYLPGFQVVDRRGLQIDSIGFRGRNVVLLFVSPTCKGCARVLDNLAPLSRRGEVIVLCRGSNRECEQLARQHSLTIPVGLDVDDKVSDLLHINGVPTAVVIDPEGRIRSYGYPEFGAEAEAVAAVGSDHRS